MFSAKKAIPLALLLAACEPASQDAGLDQNALVDQKPVRTEGWEVRGASEAKFDGLSLSASPVVESDGFTRQQVTLPTTTLSRQVGGLSQSLTGTLRLQFSIPRLPESGFRFGVEFATGQGTPAKLFVTNSGMSLSCGSGEPDSIETFTRAIGERVDHDLRLVRNADNTLSLVFNDDVLVSNLVCASDATPREAGAVKISVFAQQPKSRKALSAAQFELYRTELLLKRITIYKDAQLTSSEL